jgi:Ca-activated chloride channel family protein
MCKTGLVVFLASVLPTTAVLLSTACRSGEVASTSAEDKASTVPKKGVTVPPRLNPGGENHLTAKARAEMIDEALKSIPQDSQKTMSPFFFVLSKNPDADKLPLKSTRADVNIAGVIAEVKLTQIYKNSGKNPIEALYLFPASIRAAVFAMKMTVGDRVINAEIKEKQAAKKEYEQAVAEGKTASLLEQQRPNVFEMSVGNILPGDDIIVEISYTELLISKDRIFEFVLPAVVGPRYSNQSDAGETPDEKWVATPYLHEGRAPTYTFGVDLSLSGAMPIAGLTCPSHNATIEYKGNASAHVKLPDGPFGNKDFLIRYSLSGDQIQDGVLLYKGEDESFFLAMVQPPSAVRSEQIVPREYVFIMDVSGSMNGFPIAVSKKLMRSLFSNLRANDFFNVVLFAGNSALLSDKSLPANRANIEQALNLVDSQQGGGGTELLPALDKALALPRIEGTSRIVVIATDGYVRVEKEAFEAIRANLSKANFFAFGIGKSVNRFLIEGMARAGMGESFVAENEAAAETEAQKLRTYIESPVLTGITATFAGFDAYDVEPESIPDLFAERPVVLFGKYRGDAEGTLSIKGRNAAGNYERTIALTPSETNASTSAFGSATLSKKHSALRYLWARDRIARLDDFNQLGPDEARTKEITELGLKYNLMTDYTSFVAVDTMVRADGKKVETVRQPLPLPEGVSGLAVGKRDSISRYALRGPEGGGGGYGQGTIGLGSLGTIGHGGGGGTGSGYGRGAAGIGGRSNSASNVRSGSAMVKGALSKEVIRRIVHRHINEVKFCYERELSKQPALSGRVSIKFIIKADGTVQMAAVADSTIGSPVVENCIAEAVRRWAFPVPEGGGSVIVTYPFQLELSRNPAK